MFFVVVFFLLQTIYIPESVYAELDKFLWLFDLKWSKSVTLREISNLVIHG
jgi:hypothetical protein